MGNTSAANYFPGLAPELQNQFDSRSQGVVAARLFDLGSPATKSANDVHAAYAGNQANNNFPGPINAIDVPRTLIATFAAAWDGGDIVITGTNQFDEVVTETLLSNPAGTRAGTQVFKTVTAIAKTAVGGAADAASLGFGDTLGVPANLASTELQLTKNGVSIAGTVNVAKDSITPGSAPDGTLFIALVNVQH